MTTDLSPEDAGIADPSHLFQNSVRPLRLLLVDDEEDMLETMADILRITGFAIGTASSGQSAIEQFHTQPYDVVLLDLTMPVMNGVETLRRIRANHPGTAFIVITGHTDGELVTQARAEPLLALLIKPVNFPQLVGLLKDYAQSHLRFLSSPAAAILQVDAGTGGVPTP